MRDQEIKKLEEMGEILQAENLAQFLQITAGIHFGRNLKVCIHAQRPPTLMRYHAGICEASTPLKDVSAEEYLDAKIDEVLTEAEAEIARLRTVV